MRLIARLLSLSGCLVLSSGILMADSSPSPCPPVSLVVGSAASNGMVQFTLIASDNGLYTVQVAVSAGDTSAAIASKIAAAVNNSSWQAAINPDWSVTFSHNSGGTWSNVSSIGGLVGTAGASLKLLTTNVKSYVELQLVSSAVAAGHGSSILFSVPGEDVSLNLGLFQGQSASSIMDAVAAYLSSGGPGLSYVRLSPTKIGIHFHYVNSWVSFQTNDTGLQGKATESDQCLSCTDLTGLIRN
jgi:hypothetical protein